MLVNVMVWGWLPALKRFTTCGAKLKTDGETLACCENAYGINWNIKTENTTGPMFVHFIEGVSTKVTELQRSFSLVILCDSAPLWQNLD